MARVNGVGHDCHRQLLVADACAGLNRILTLDALGMRHMNLMKYTNAARNVALMLMLVLDKALGWVLPAHRRAAA